MNADLNSGFYQEPIIFFNKKASPQRG